MTFPGNPAVPPDPRAPRWIWIPSVDNVASWRYIDPVKAVGLRELKNRLAEYVRQVRAGEEVLVTDRGAVVAELGPPGRAMANGIAPAGLVELANRGLLTLGAPNDPAAYPKLPRLLTPGRVTRLLDEERGPR